MTKTTGPVTRFYKVSVWNVDTTTTEYGVQASEMDLANQVDKAHLWLTFVEDEEQVRVVTVDRQMP